MTAARALDVVVFGATGYTGQLVTAHLAEVAPLEDVKWGIAGRSEEKLKALLKEVKAPADTPVFVADAGNTDSLDAVCKQATVIIACAGPFAKFGMPIVDACVKNGTHYCDITGESNFVRLMIEKHHETATKSGVILVPQAGFDSVPGDVCNFVVNDYARAQGINVTDVVSFYRTKGTFSRGTFDTMVEGIEGNNMVKADRSPVSLNPEDGKKNVRINKPWAFPWYAGKTIGWAGFFVMSLCNNKLVRRTNALLGYKSSYDEAAQAKGMFACFMQFFGLILFVITMKIKPLRNKLQPAANTGPSAKTANTPFTVTCRGTIVADKKVIQTTMKSEINAYPATAVFAAQIAISIAHDIVRDQKSSGVIGAPKAGVLTSMTAVGPLLLPRLARNKITVTPAAKTD